MKIIKEALFPYKNLFIDLKNTISRGLFIYFLVYSCFIFYSTGVLDRVVGSGNPETLFMMKIVLFAQEIPVLCFVLFYLKNIYLRIIKKEKEDIFGKNTDSFRRVGKKFKLFLFSLVVVYALGFFANHYFLLMVLLFFSWYFFLLPAFLIIEKPQTNYKLSCQIIKRAIKACWIKINLVAMAVCVLYEIIRCFIVFVPVGYIAYLVIESEGRVTVGMLMAISALCNFILVYVGMVLYVRLSLNMYLIFKDRILDEMERVKLKCI